jgi:hypothetical protein
VEEQRGQRAMLLPPLAKVIRAKFLEICKGRIDVTK